MYAPRSPHIGLRPAPGRAPPQPAFFSPVIGYSFLHYYIINANRQTTVTAALRRLRSIINPETAFTKYSNIQFLQSIQRLQCHHLRLSKLHKVLYKDVVQHRSPRRHPTSSWEATSYRFAAPASTSTSVSAKSSVRPGPRPVITLPSTTAALSVANIAPDRYFSKPG